MKNDDLFYNETLGSKHFFIIDTLTLVETFPVPNTFDLLYHIMSLLFCSYPTNVCISSQVDTYTSFNFKKVNYCK